MSPKTDFLNLSGYALAQSLLTRLYTVSPYEDFDYQAIPLNLQGWGSTDLIFDKLISTVQPRLILEVGTWKGASAIHMASLLKEKGIDTAIVCIDTWLGGLEHLIHKEDPELGLSNLRKHGYPTLYYQFLANVMHQGFQDRIVPFPSTSNIAAKWFEHYQIKADLIYIDSSHDQHDVYQDLKNYWQLLTHGGIMFGDDWSEPWRGVIAAVSEFAKVQQLDVKVDGQKWFFRKV
ncbi:MAG: class I SAM-dependent methyltransferase [Brasilonema angustatum HA4187-MV1]|jgi:predicted O-methyltransferase YrrM|nr:class I SAM-dependent methyltransferase [Brasilonema angustatum HA4187-MV1]